MFGSSSVWWNEWSSSIGGMSGSGISGGMSGGSECLVNGCARNTSGMIVVLE